MSRLALLLACAAAVVAPLQVRAGEPGAAPIADPGVERSAQQGAEGAAGSGAERGAESPRDAGPERRSAHVRLGYERLGLEGGETLGLLGTTYLVDIAPGVAVGPALYGAVSGRRGGFFTYGAEVAWRTHLAASLELGFGTFVGGGGGGAAPQGGGLMLRPHADLLWHAGGPYSLGLSLADVRFPNGRIDSTQLGVVLEVASDFASFPAAGLDVARSAPGRTGVGVDRVQTLASVYRPRPGTRRLDGSAAPAQIALLGVRAEQAFGSGRYWGIEANGAAAASVAGYAETLGTLAFEGSLADRVHVGTRVALGMGGGGALPVGGGLLAKAALYGRVELTDALALSLEVGAMTAPRGGLRAATIAGSLVWALEPAHNAASSPPVRIDVGAGVERFAARRVDGTRRSVTVDVLTASRFVAPNLYLSGQVHSAVAGAAGGYSAALLGLGWSATPLASRWLAGTEILAGPAGGGGVDIRGSIVQWNAYAGLRLTPAIALRASGGWLGSTRGGSGSAVAGVGVIASFGVNAP